jgi:hypothetical protein
MFGQTMTSHRRIGPEGAEKKLRIWGSDVRIVPGAPFWQSEGLPAPMLFSVPPMRRRAGRHQTGRPGSRKISKTTPCKVAAATGPFGRY